MDPNSITPAGDGLFYVWLREDYYVYHQDAAGDWINQEMTRYLVDCEGQRMALVNMVQRLDGQVVWSGDFTDRPIDWSTVVPDSRGAAWHEGVCEWSQEAGSSS